MTINERLDRMKKITENVYFSWFTKTEDQIQEEIATHLATIRKHIGEQDAVIAELVNECKRGMNYIENVAISSCI